MSRESLVAQIKNEIAALTRALDALGEDYKGRHMSPEARERISAAQRKRWAEAKKAPAPKKEAEASRKK